MVSVQGWSEQSFPPLLAPEATSIFSNNGVLAVVHFNHTTTSPVGNVPGKPGNSLSTITIMGFTSERALYAWSYWWARYTAQDNTSAKQCKWLLHLYVPGRMWVSAGSSLIADEILPELASNYYLRYRLNYSVLPLSHGPSSFNAILHCWLKHCVISWMSNNIWQ